MPEKDEEGGSSNKLGKPFVCEVDLIPMKREGEEGQDWIFLREFWSGQWDVPKKKSAHYRNPTLGRNSPVYL